MEGKFMKVTSAMTLDKLGGPHVPPSYVLPQSQRATPGMNLTNLLPIVDLSTLHDVDLRSNTIQEIRNACTELGFFQVINHGIPSSVMKDALDVAEEFFDLPTEEKMLLWSDNVHEPVRYGTSLNHAVEEVHFWRDFIKQYSYPISDWIHLWPSNPPTYKKKIGVYAKATQELQLQLTEVVLETLGLEKHYLKKEVEKGSQVFAVNCYPACPEPELSLGMPPHSDYGSMTILLQSCPGLQVLDHEDNWLSVPVVEGALLVQLGDQLEVMSNGIYKSIVHRVTLNTKEKRLSIASLHSLGINKTIGPAPELVDEEHPPSYNDFSFQEFLDYISKNDIRKKRFIDTLKKN